MHARPLRLALLGLAAILTGMPAGRAETLHVGKASPNSISMVPVDIAAAQGLFKKHGLAVELISFQGPAKMHQAIAAGSIDIGIGAGPELEFIIEGSPEIAVADMTGLPLFLGMVVPYESPARSADDLRASASGSPRPDPSRSG